MLDGWRRLESVTQAFKSRGRYVESITAHLGLTTGLGMRSRVHTHDGPADTGPRRWGGEFD